VLVTDEVVDGATRTRIANEIMAIENVQGVWNELTIKDNNSLAVPINAPLWHRGSKPVLRIWVHRSLTM
jgi:hypothetical protein